MTFVQINDTIKIRNENHILPTKKSERGVFTMSKKEITEAAAEARRKYQKAWYAKNRDKVKAYHQKYWERKAASIAADTSEAKAVKQCD